MIRNLKALVLAGMALAVFGALAASSAQAHTPAEFHSHLDETTITVKTDGTSKTAHQVFDAPGGGSVTCDGITGDGLITKKTVTSIDVVLDFHGCTAFGQPATVDSTSCTFTFTAAGHVSFNGPECFLGVTVAGCTISFTPGETYTTITYHNINALPNPSSPTVEGTATYTTVSAAVEGIKGTETGAGCPAPGAFTSGNFTTGNAIIEGEKPKTTEMTSVWWTPTVA